MHQLKIKAIGSQFIMKRNIVVGMVVAILIGVITVALGVANSGAEEDETGSEAQTVGILVNVEQTPPEVVSPFIVEPLEQDMAEYGYVRGDNIEYVVELPFNRTLDEAAQALVDAEPSLILALDVASFEAVNAVRDDIPIIAQMPELDYTEQIRDVILEEGSGITAVISAEAHEKRFDLLMQIVPEAETVFVIDRPDAQMTNAFERIAPAYDVTLETYVFDENMAPASIVSVIPEGIDAIVVDIDTAFVTSELASWGLQTGVPLVGPATLELPGLLMTYGSDVTEFTDIIARLAQRIFDGTDVNDLPVEVIEPVLLLHVGTADAIGIEIPDAVLEQAQYVITDPVTFASTEGFCTATLETPLGDDQICVTQSCASLVNNAQATYLDREEVDSCSAENVIGICSADDRSTYFYSGNATLFEQGCVAQGNTWQTQ